MTHQATGTQWMTTDELGDHLGLSRSTLERYIRDGMPKHQPGGPNGRRMFALDEVDSWLRSRCTRRVAGGES